MWTEDRCDRLNKLSTVILTGDYPSVVLNKMSCSRLESVVTQLIQYSCLVGDANCISSKLSRPQWWPKHLKFKDPIAKLRPRPDAENHDALFKWSCTLRDLVESCSRFHRGATASTHRLRRTVLAPRQYGGGGDVLAKSYLNFSRLKSKENNWVSNRRKKYPKRNLTVEGKCDINLYNLAPVVKLCDFAKPCKKQRNCTVQLRQVNHWKHAVSDGKILTRAHVRLQQLYEKPKQFECTKDSYMQYFNLGQTSHVSCLSLMRNKPSHSKAFRSFNIPISSELGQMLVPNTPDSDNAAWRLQRLEWFLKEMPQVKYEQGYPITFTRRGTADSCLTHTYKFPKRQHYQTRLSVKRYSRLHMCKPVCVLLERLDFSDSNYSKYLN